MYLASSKKWVEFCTLLAHASTRPLAAAYLALLLMAGFAIAGLLASEGHVMLPYAAVPGIYRRNATSSLASPSPEDVRETLYDMMQRHGKEREVQASQRPRILRKGSLLGKTAVATPPKGPQTNTKRSQTR